MARQSNEELTLNGVKIDSLNEWNVGKALEKLGLDFAYQFYVGGAGLRGSQIIDFLVYTAPKPQPLYVYGDFWHGGQYAQETELKATLINSKMRGIWNMAVVIWEHECETEEQAYNAVRTKLAV